MQREADPAARALIAELLRLEDRPWPGAMAAYAEALLALATRCEFKAGQSELYRWASRALHAVLHEGDDDLRECRIDGLADVVMSSMGRLLMFRSTLVESTPPNLQSMLAQAVRWRAKDLIESRHRRHARRRGEGEAWQPAPASPFTRLLAREVHALLADAGAAGRALVMIGEGESIAEAARRTGASRQQVYRARERVRAGEVASE